MKMYCKYSGVLLQQSELLAGLDIPNKKQVLLSEHILFNPQYTLNDILHIASSKPQEKLTEDQRHLLAVAMMHHTGVIKIKSPVTKEILTPNRLFKIFDKLAEYCIRISSNRNLWQKILKRQPRIEVRLDNSHDIDLVSFIKDQLNVSTSLLLFTNMAYSSAREADTRLDDEIEFEYQLKKQLRTHRKTREHYSFELAMGKFVINELHQILKKEDSTGVSAETRERAIYLFTTPKEKIVHTKANAAQIKALRDMIVDRVKISIDVDDTISRTYTALTVGLLDDVLDYLNHVNNIFGAVTKQVPARLSKEYPVQYTVSEIVTPSPLDRAGTELPAPKNPNLANSKNPLIQKILARKAAEQAAATTEGSTDETK